MKKRMLTMLLALMLIVSVIPFAASAACKHVYDLTQEPVEIVKAATCTERGIYRYKCTKCTATEKFNVEPTGHKPETIAEVAPTCTTAGKTAGSKCSVCNIVLVKPKTADPALGHDYKPSTHTCKVCKYECKHEGKLLVEKIAAKAATCYEGPFSAGYECSECGYVKAPEATGSARGHIFKNGICKDCKYVCGHTEEYKNGACATCGVACEHKSHKQNGVCKSCGQTVEHSYKMDYCTVCNKACPHDYELVSYKDNVAPTCTSTAIGIHKCKICGAPENITVAKVAHTPVAYEEVAATCNAEGRSGGKYCSVCKTHLEDRTVLKKLNHNITADPATMIGKAEKEPTCTTAGSGIFRCASKGCEAYARREIPALGHKLVTWKGFDATCLEEGRTDGEWCERCTKDHITKQRQVIPVLKHDYNVWIRTTKEATCLEDGSAVFKCFSKCNGYLELPVEKLGHDDKVLEYWPATCTSNGCTKYECQREGCPEKIRYVDSKATGHVPETLPAVEATCSITGLTEGKQCATCLAILEAQTVIEKEAHTWTDVVGQNATCTENGYTSHKKCSVCGTVEGKSVIEASHYYNDVRCTVCGEANPEYVAPGHGDHDKDDHNKPGHGGNHGHPDFIDPDDNGDNKPDQGGNNVESGDKDDNKQPSQGGNNGGSGDKDDNKQPSQGGSNGGSGDKGHNHRVCKHEHQTTVTQNKTCTTNGSVISYCTDCDTVITVTPDVATGHNFVMGACAVCGEYDPAVYTNDFNNYYIVGGSTK